MALKIRKEDALQYHEQGKPGKIEVVPTKSVSTQHDLALAYSPGVAEPCLAIAENIENVYRYTAKGNLVAVISNGTAVLGLGDIGPEASKPVMEGKGVLFKKFAGIDVFDIEIDCKDPKEFIRIVKSLEPTFGGINLEDIKAPECFEIEQTLRKEMNIPIMHDDQHGTAIITAAALLNALEIVQKNIGQVNIVVNGAGAAAISCTSLFIALGANPENIVMLDSKGVIRKDNPDLDKTKIIFATNKELHTLEQAMEGVDVFLGLSKGNVVTPAMLLSMAENPIVFACANPDPEIAYDFAMATRPDLLMATGRSDHPNQVNNVLGFPYIFRGALDVRATCINEEMKLAAVRAIAQLAKELVPDMVNKAYDDKVLAFGREYFIPKPLDPRLITLVSPAVAKAAMETGVAKYPITDWDEYHHQLLKRIGLDNRLMSRMVERAKKNPKRVIFAEADNLKTLKAVQAVQDDHIAFPILLGDKAKIQQLIAENNLDLHNCQIIDPAEEHEKREHFAQLLYQKRQRKGLNLHDARKLVFDRTYFGTLMLDEGEADAFISGLMKDYARIIRPALEVIGVRPEVNVVAGMYVIVSNGKTLFLADTTVNIDPTTEELVSIIGLTKGVVQAFGYAPRVAVLSYSNFGSNKGDIPVKTAQAARQAKLKYPEMLIDGDIQANVALNTQLLRDNYPFSDLAQEGANTLIFPNLASGNIAYKLLQEVGAAETVGPILLGMKKPVHILQLGSSVREIVDIVTLAVVDAQGALKG